MQPVAISGMWPCDADITGPGESEPRIRAISIVHAYEVSTQANVRDFRRKYGGLKPGDHLVTAHEVLVWVLSRTEIKESPSWWLTNLPVNDLIAIADGGYLLPAALMRQVRKYAANEVPPDNAPYLAARQVTFATPLDAVNTEYVREVGGPLDSLRTLARALARQHYWTEAHAATFVLTGYAPLVSPDDFPLPEGSGRQQTDRALQLAALWVMREVEHVPLAARLDEWNARYPQWRYGTTSNFGRDSRDAVRRLINPPVRKRQKASAQTATT